MNLCADEPAVESKSEFYLNCAIEDTNEGCYRDITSSLLSKGFKRVVYRSHKKYNKIEKKIRRIPLKDVPMFIWTIAEKDVDFPELKEDQIVNHFEGITMLTTKMGFCDILRDFPSISEDMMEVSPRSYNIGDPTHREEFIEDFNITAATNILKYYFYQQYNNYRCNNPRRDKEINDNYMYYDVEKSIKNCVKCITMYLRVKLSGEWPGVERSFPDPDVPKLHGLEEKEWQSIREIDYFIAENIPFGENIAATTWRKLIAAEKLPYISSKFTKVWLLLRGLYRVNKQLFIDGTKNIWIVKAPDTCCGVGIKLLYRLADIIECEKGMGGRTVQKYIESPLLTLLQTPAAAPSTPYLTKFDLRIWVLVTSMEPLKAYIYSTVYGRHCVHEFNLSVKSLGDNSMHLTNYSIQRKSNGNEGDTASTGINAIRKLRGSVASSGASEALTSPRACSNQTVINTQTDLLLTHREILEIVGVDTWNNRIWPGIKASISSTLKVAKEHVKHRDKSFEFLGYDVLIDELCNPWILEVNMSPALAHRCDSHNNVIKKMADGIINLTVLPHVAGINAADADVSSWEVLYDEAITIPEEVAPAPKPTPTLCSSNITYTTSTNDEWSAVAPSRRRPKSANASSRPKSASATSMVHSRLQSALQGNTTVQCDASALFKSVSSNIDISFMVTGKAISNQSIDFFDCLISNYLHMLALQRWSKRVLRRVRLYHSTRRAKCIVVQKYYRRHAARGQLVALRRRKFAIYIQCLARVYLAKLAYLCRKKCRAATRIQCRVRRAIACKKAAGLRRQVAKNRIVCWYRSIYTSRRVKASAKIVAVGKRWLRRRVLARAAINRAITSYHRRQRFRMALMIHRSVYIVSCWLSRRWLRWKRAQVKQCQRVSGIAMAALELYLRKKEVGLFSCEDSLSAMLRDAPQLVTPAVCTTDSYVHTTLEAAEVMSPLTFPPAITCSVSPSSPFEGILDCLPPSHPLDHSLPQPRITYNKQKSSAEMDSIDGFVSKYGRVTASDLRLLGIYDSKNSSQEAVTKPSNKKKECAEKAQTISQYVTASGVDSQIPAVAHDDDEERYSKYALSYSDAKDPETANSILQMQTMLKYYKSNGSGSRKAGSHLRPTSASESRKLQSTAIRSLVPEHTSTATTAVASENNVEKSKKKRSKKSNEESPRAAVSAAQQADPKPPVTDDKWFQAVWQEFGPNSYSNIAPPLPSQPKPHLSRPTSANGTKKSKSNPNYLYEYSGINHIDYQFTSKALPTTAYSYGTENTYYSSNRGVDVGFNLDDYDDKNLRKIKKKKKERSKPSTFSNYIFEHPFL